jgi:hypothetical protein
MSEFEDGLARARMNGAVMRELARGSNAAALEHLKQYVTNRRRNLEGHKRMDPHSPQTQVAKRMVSEAQQELEAFARSIGEPLTATEDELKNAET